MLRFSCCLWFSRNQAFSLRTDTLHGSLTAWFKNFCPVTTQELQKLRSLAMAYLTPGSQQQHWGCNLVCFFAICCAFTALGQAPKPFLTWWHSLLQDNVFNSTSLAKQQYACDCVITFTLYSPCSAKQACSKVHNRCTTGTHTKSAPKPLCCAELHVCCSNRYNQVIAAGRGVSRRERGA